MSFHIDFGDGQTTMLGMELPVKFGIHNKLQLIGIFIHWYVLYIYILNDLSTVCLLCLNICLYS